jgi:Flp pilus assembly protein TadB
MNIQVEPRPAVVMNIRICRRPCANRAFAPYYLLAAAFGMLCFVVQLTLNTGWMRLIALGWVVIVPLWIRRYRQHRNARRSR